MIISLLRPFSLDIGGGNMNGEVNGNYSTFRDIYAYNLNERF